MPGTLFTEYFLTDGIKATSQWELAAALDSEFQVFVDGVKQRYTTIASFHEPNEAVTELEIILPVLELLGWVDYLPQQGASRNQDIPDLLLFGDSASKERAAARTGPAERFLDAVLVEESKRFDLPLDSRNADDQVQMASPNAQILRYLGAADIESDSRIRWGILTNGRLWRLYDHRARPRLSGYFEVDLGELFASGDVDSWRVFYLLFCRQSFTPQSGSATSFLEDAIAEGRRYEQRVADDLSAVIFGRAFPNLVQAMSDATQMELADLRGPALILLYRLLFVLYAEDRGLLPVNDSRYEDYGLRKPVRDDVARRMEDRTTFSGLATNYYDHLMTLGRLIDQGDPQIGMPPYNGGLFNDVAAPLLKGVHLSDAAMAPVIYDLSHTEIDGGRRFVNYRDMSVQQLGSIYERLLEREPAFDDGGKVVVRPNNYVRKDTGSFFTPQELVDLIVERTLKPLAEERVAAFENKAAELVDDPRALDERCSELAELDPAEAVLDLKVLDPAMGSGHFLVTAVDFLTEYIAELIGRPSLTAGWFGVPYSSPLVGRIDAIRHDILERARELEWVIDESQLTDQAIIRRMVLKRCIYGVDKNPLTVELAKVSLWLHSFTVGAPLSFLDHHLRCGDSLIGMRVKEATSELTRLGGLFATVAVGDAELATADMERIEEMSDADIAEVQQSASLFHEVEETTSSLRSVIHMIAGLQWLTAGMKKNERQLLEGPIAEALGVAPNDAFTLLADGAYSDGTAVGSEYAALWNAATRVAEKEGFLHWEVAFPGVWKGWQHSAPEGGFDAVIGNPPWDRIKLQEVEWFATRSRPIALADTADGRKKGIAALRAAGSPLVQEFDEAKKRAESLSGMVRECKHYPLMGKGDINLYSLFVERAKTLIKPDGMVGLLTPSGLYADLTASAFFKEISANGRVSSLLDFENRRLGTGLISFFPDVDDRFKFCALIFGGEERTFNEIECAYFLGDLQDLMDRERCFPLSAADFQLVNPNTGTSPVFRTRRDADLTRRVYKDFPVLVNRADGSERKTWPVRYRNMFHMTNDSGLFRTEARLVGDGYYPVDGNHMKRGGSLYLPLYEGKMVQAHDHRAASVVVNPNNVNRPGQPKEVGASEHLNPGWLPKPRYWVSEDEVNVNDWVLGIKHVSSPTNARTVIAALVPRAGYGNSLPILVPSDEKGTEAMLAGKKALALLVANLNSFALDFVARQKLHGQNLNLYVLEQLPVVPLEGYDRMFGSKSASELVLDHVLRLTYTAVDMTTLARDLGYDGDPFVWDDEERLHLRARLDALYFHLYGMSGDDAEYVLSTFPIVEKEECADFGVYRTRNLVLRYMNALSADDVESKVDG